MSEDRCTKGWSWGQYRISPTGVDLVVDNQLGLRIPYTDIANCSNPGKNEIALEFQHDDTMEDDIVCELRLFVPDTDGCEALSKEIVDGANLRAYAGEALVTLYNLPMVVPRGKYSMDMFANSIRLHGQTYNYKVMYKNITRAFLLPKPDGVHFIFVIGLDTPIRQGNTLHPYIVMQFNKDKEESVTVNMAPAEIQRVYGDDLCEVLEGKQFDIVSRLFKAMAKVNIIIPRNFTSASDSFGIKCSVRASEGHLFPLEKSFIFVNKPVIYIRFEDVRYIEFARVSERSMSTNRSFDLHITTKQGGFQFTGIDRHEYRPLCDYLEQKRIPIRNLEEEDDRDKEVISSDDNIEIGEEDDEDDESFAGSEESDQVQL